MQKEGIVCPVNRRKSLDKQKFLEELKQTLAGEVDSRVIVENVTYYDDYIMTKLRQGAQEDEVLSELGDPRLLAKTIIETSSDAQYHARAYQYEEPQIDREELPHSRVLKITGLRALIALAVIALILIGLLTAAITIFSALLPIILMAAAVFFVVTLFRNLFR